MDSWAHETTLLAQGYQSIAGVDEAGRGPLAGPVVAAAVILPFGLGIPGLTDSKQLTPRRREQLYGAVYDQAIAVGVASVSPAEIDRRNILQATLCSMQQAIHNLEIQPDYALVDGNRVPSVECGCSAIIKGDQLSANIAAASVVAKVTRDRLMVEHDSRYPGYGFARHKGYPTREHYAALEELGATPIHRRSFRLFDPGSRHHGR